MTLKEFLEMGILSYNLVIIQKRICKSCCINDCSCVSHPLVDIVRNKEKVTKEMIVKKGRPDLLDKKIIDMYALGSSKTCIILEG